MPQNLIQDLPHQAPPEPFSLILDCEACTELPKGHYGWLYAFQLNVIKNSEMP